MRERMGRTLPVVTMSEADGVSLVTENVDRMATLSADEASHWDMLHAGWKVDRVNHRKPTATTASTPTGLKAISRAFVVWCRASTTTSARDTCTSMQPKPLGWRTTAAEQRRAGLRAGAECDGLPR